MAITTRDGLIDALANNSSRIVIDKASLANAAAGQHFSLWTATGVPGAGSAPGAAENPTSATTGAMGFANQTAPATSYIAWLSTLAGNSATNLEIHDRLAHMGGLSGTVTTSQGALSLVTNSPGADRLGDADRTTGDSVGGRASGSPRSRARGSGLHRSAGHHRGDNACCDGSSGCVLRRTASFCWV